MHDWTDELELDEDGRLRRKKQVLPDGTRLHVPMQFMDKFSDGTPDPSNPNGPGFRVLDSDDPRRIAANDAYAARCAAMDYRTRKAKKHPDEDDDEDENGRHRLSGPAAEESAWHRRQALAHRATAKAMGGDAQTTLDALRDAADAAWRERNARMSQAWRKRA